MEDKNFSQYKNFRIEYQVTVYKDKIYIAETEDEARDLWHKEFSLDDAEILDVREDY